MAKSISALRNGSDKVLDFVNEAQKAFDARLILVVKKKLAKVVAPVSLPDHRVGPGQLLVPSLAEDRQATRHYRFSPHVERIPLMVNGDLHDIWCLTNRKLPNAVASDFGYLSLDCGLFDENDFWESKESSLGVHLVEFDILNEVGESARHNFGITLGDDV